MFKYIQIEKLLSEDKSASEIAEIVPCSIAYAGFVKRNLGIVNGTEQIVEHHTHYKELHGYDKTVWMTRSEHFKLHQRLRKNSECNVPVDELTKISMAAIHRTDKCKKYDAKREKNPKRIKSKHDYYLKNMWLKHYWTYMMPYITLKETIGYNITTNHISVSSGFYGTRKIKPLVINII